MGLDPTLGIAIVLLVVAASLYWRARRRAGARRARADAARPAPAPAPAAGAPGAWAPPHYAAALPPAPEGPSLKTGINILRRQGDSLLVSWNAVIDGTVPVEVQWGAPVVRPGEGDALQLRYVVEGPAGGVFQAPETRTCQPGEIISRSVTVAGSAIGQDFAGLRVTVALGYGAAEGHAAAAADEAAYLAWQKTAVSPTRVAPGG